MTVTTQAKDLSCWVFLRSWDSPYALRLHLTLEDAKFFSSKVTELVAEMTSEDWDATTTKLDIPCFIGEQSEEGPKQYDGPRTYFEKDATPPKEETSPAPKEEAASPSDSTPSWPPKGDWRHELGMRLAKRVFGESQQQQVPSPVPSAPPHELAARQAVGAVATIAKGLLKRIFR